jgi:hypothetical protein
MLHFTLTHQLNGIIMYPLQPSFAMADQARAGRAKSLLAGTLRDLHGMELELRAQLDREIALKEEIPELKKEVISTARHSRARTSRRSICRAQHSTALH